MAFASSSESSVYGSGASTRVLSEAAIYLSPKLLEEGLLACGIPVPPGVVKIASKLLSAGAKHCAKVVSYSSSYPCGSLPSAAEIGEARIVHFKVLSRPLNSNGFLSKFTKAAMHHFVFLKCVCEERDDDEDEDDDKDDDDDDDSSSSSSSSSSSNNDDSSHSASDSDDDSKEKEKEKEKEKATNVKAKKNEFYMVFEFNEDSKVSMHFVKDDLSNYGKYHKKYPSVKPDGKGELPLYMFFLWCYEWTSVVEYDMEKLNCKAFCTFMDRAYEEKRFSWTKVNGYKSFLEYGDGYNDAKKKKFAKGFNDGGYWVKRTKDMMKVGKKISSFLGIEADLSDFW